MPFGEVGVHSIKAGGLLGERLKGAHNPVSRPRRLYIQFHLVIVLILFLLMPDIRPDHRFVQPYRGNKIPSGPEYLSGEILRSSTIFPGNRDRALALDVSDYVRNRIFRRNANAHVHVIRHDVPFHNLRFLVLRQLMEYLPELLAKHPEYPLLPLFRDEHDVVLAGDKVKSGV